MHAFLSGEWCMPQEKMPSISPSMKNGNETQLIPQSSKIISSESFGEDIKKFLRGWEKL